MKLFARSVLVVGSCVCVSLLSASSVFLIVSVSSGLVMKLCLLVIIEVNVIFLDLEKNLDADISLPTQPKPYTRFSSTLTLERPILHYHYNKDGRRRTEP